MTRQEAIFILECVEAHGLAEDAKRIALEALKEEPVKHGRWIWNNRLGEWYCSECDRPMTPYIVETSDGEYAMAQPFYCGWCGAKMGESTMGQVKRHDAVNEEENHEQRID